MDGCTWLYSPVPEHPERHLTASVVVLIRGLMKRVETQNATSSSCMSRTMYTCMHRCYRKDTRLQV